MKTTTVFCSGCSSKEWSASRPTWRSSTTGIDQALGAHNDKLKLLTQIPGVDRIVAITIIAELGTDMTVFPRRRSKLLPGRGVCPGNNESAGKRRGQAKRRGNVHLSTALVQAAFAASRKTGCYLKERFWRLSARRGKKRAAMAVAHSILIAAYEMLRRDAEYRDLGARLPQPARPRPRSRGAWYAGWRASATA